MPNRVIVVGASAGGVEALRTLVRGLTPDIQAPVLVVMHMWPYGPSMLPAILANAGSITVTEAVNDAPSEDGHVYIARPDCPLLVERGHMHVSYRPKENRHRPSINMLFRAAALAYGKAAIGVVL